MSDINVLIQQTQGITINDLLELCDSTPVDQSVMEAEVISYRKQYNINSVSSMELHVRIKEAFRLRLATVKLVRQMWKDGILKAQNFLSWVVVLSGDVRAKLGLAWGDNLVHILGNIVFQVLLFGTEKRVGRIKGLVIDFEDFVTLSSVGTADILIYTKMMKALAVDFTAKVDVPPEKVQNIMRHVSAGFVDYAAILIIKSFAQSFSKESLLENIKVEKLQEEMRPGVKLAKLLVGASQEIREMFIKEASADAKSTYLRHLESVEPPILEVVTLDQSGLDAEVAQSNKGNPLVYLSQVCLREDSIGREVTKTMEEIKVSKRMKPTLILGSIGVMKMDLELLAQASLKSLDHEIFLSILVLEDRGFLDGVVYACKTVEDFFRRKYIVMPRVQPKHLESKGRLKASWIRRNWPVVDDSPVDCVFTVGTKSRRFKLVRNLTTYTGVLEKMEGYHEAKSKLIEYDSLLKSPLVPNLFDDYEKFLDLASQQSVGGSSKFSDLERIATLQVEDPKQREWLLSTVKTSEIKLVEWADSDRELAYQITEILDRAQGRGWFYPTVNSTGSLLVLVKTSQNLGTFKDVSYRACHNGTSLKGIMPGAHAPSFEVPEIGGKGLLIMPWLTMERNMLEWKLKQVHHMVMRVGLVLEHNKTVRPGKEVEGEKIVEARELAEMLLPITINRQQFSLIADAVRYSYVGSTGAALDPKGLFSKMAGVAIGSMAELVYSLRAVKQHAAISYLTQGGEMGKVMSKLSPGLPIVPMPETRYGRVDPQFNTNLIYTKTIMNVSKTHTLAYEALDVLGLLEELEIYKKAKEDRPQHVKGMTATLERRVMKAKSLSEVCGFSDSAIYRKDYNEFVATLSDSRGQKLRYTWDAIATVAAADMNGSVGSLDRQTEHKNGRNLHFLENLASTELLGLMGTQGSIELGELFVKPCRKGSGIVQLLHAVVTGVVLPPSLSYSRLRSICRQHPTMSVSMADAALFLMTCDLTLIIRLFDKDQVGSNREISAMNAVGVVLTNVSETAYSLRARGSLTDLIGNASKDTIIQAKILKWQSLDGSLKVAFNKDCSRFGPNQMMPKFILHNSLVTSNPDVFSFLSASSLKMMNKDMKFPGDLADQLRRDRGQYGAIADNKTSSYSAVVRKIEELGSEMFEKCSIRMCFGMGQGLMGAQASHGHDDAICFRSKLMMASEKWSGRLRYEDYGVTSDDSTLYTCFQGIKGNFTAVAREFAQDDAWILLAFGLLTNTAKSVATTTSPEFNSEFTIKGKPIRSFAKIAHALIDIPSGETPLGDLHFASSQGKELLAHGGSVFLAFVLAMLCMDLVISQQNKRYMLTMMSEQMSKLESGLPTRNGNLNSHLLAPEMGGLPYIDPLLSVLHPLAPWVSSVASKQWANADERDIALKKLTLELMTLKTSEEMASVGLALTAKDSYSMGVSGTLIMQARPSSKKKRLIAELGIGRVSDFADDSVSYGNNLLVKNLMLAFQRTVVNSEEDLRKDSYFGKRLVAYHRDQDKIVYNVSNGSVIHDIVGFSNFSIRDYRKALTRVGCFKIDYSSYSNETLSTRQNTLYETLKLVNTAAHNLRLWRLSGGTYIKLGGAGPNRAYFESEGFRPTSILTKNSFVPEQLRKKDKDGFLTQLASDNGVLSLITSERYERHIPRIIDTKGLLTAEKVFSTAEMQNQTLEKHLSRKARVYRNVSTSDTLTSEILTSELVVHNSMAFVTFQPVRKFHAVVNFLPQHEVEGNLLGITDQQQITNNYLTKLSRSRPKGSFSPPVYLVDPDSDLTRRGVNAPTPLLISDYQLKSTVNSSLLRAIHGTGFRLGGSYSDILPTCHPSKWFGNSAFSVKVFPIFSKLKGFVRETFRYAVTRSVTSTNTHYTTFIPNTPLTSALMTKSVEGFGFDIKSKKDYPRYIIEEILEVGLDIQGDVVHAGEGVSAGAELFEKIYATRFEHPRIKALAAAFTLSLDVSWKIYLMAMATSMGLTKVVLATDTLILVVRDRLDWLSYEDTIYSMVSTNTQGLQLILPLAVFETSPFSPAKIQKQKLPREMGLLTRGHGDAPPDFSSSAWAEEGSRASLLSKLLVSPQPIWGVSLANYAASLGLQGSGVGRLPQYLTYLEYVEHMSVFWGTNRIVGSLLTLLRESVEHYAGIERLVGSVAAFSLYCVVMVDKLFPKDSLKAQSVLLDLNDLEVLKAGKQPLVGVMEDMVVPSLDMIGQVPELVVMTEPSKEPVDDSSSTSDKSEHQMSSLLIRVKVMGDGNCFLRSIHASLVESAMMRPNPFPESFDLFKAQAILAMGSFDYSRLDEVMLMEGVPPLPYFQGLVRRGAWTENDFDLVPLIIAEVLDINIMIYQDAGITDIFPEGSHLATVEYNGHNHYDALVPDIGAYELGDDF
jgi:hypothetical protein